LKNSIKHGYSKTKIGWIPKEWKEVKLGSCLAQKPEYGINAPAVEHSSKLPTYLRITDISEDGSFIKSKKTSVNSANSSNYYLTEGDLVFARTGASTGKTYLYNPHDGKLVFAGFLIKVRCKSSVLLPEYLKQFTGTHEYWRWIRIASQRSGQPGVNGKEYAQLSIPLPPLPEQKAIASVLGCWDNAIHKYEEKIAKKKNIKKGLMQKLLSGEQRLPGFDGEWNPVPLGDTADPKKRWSFTGGPFGSNLKSSSYTKDGIRIIQLQNIGDGAFHNDSKIYTSPEKADELISCNIFPGDLILSKMGDPVARACIIPDIEDRFLMCSDGIRLSVNENQFDPFFIYSVINAKVFRSKAHRSGTGSTRRRIGLTTLRVLSLYCPPLPEQKAIASVLSSADSEIKALEKKLAFLRDQKKYLLNNLVTGTIRLPEFCKEVG